MSPRFRELYKFNKKHLLILLLLVNSFSWYFICTILVEKLSKTMPAIGAIYYISIIVSALIGSVLFNRVEYRRFILCWLLLGALASLFFSLPTGNSVVPVLIKIVILGASLGIGMPFLLNFFSKMVPVENRGFMGGLTFFMSMVSVPVFALYLGVLDLPSSSFLLFMWRIWSIPIAFLFFKWGEFYQRDDRSTSFIRVFNNKNFILYFVAWLMFSLVDVFAIMGKDQMVPMLARVIEPVVAAFSALIIGVLADKTGRKRIIISGFVSIGIAYAILGIAPDLLFSQFIFYLIDGFAIGSLWTIFTIVIWGELELVKSINNKYYSLGEAPYFLAQSLRILLFPFVSILAVTSIFPIAAFFLFLAVIPLLFAKETLPATKMHQRQLKEYTEEAIKLRERIEVKQE